MFIGRKRELAALDKLYESGKFEFAVIYVRRRVSSLFRRRWNMSSVSPRRSASS